MILFLAVAFLAISCSNNRYYKFIDQSTVQQEYSKDHVNKLLEAEPAFEGSVDSGTFQVYFRNEVITQFWDAYTYDIFYYEDNKLKYWGSVEDFKVHENENYRDVAEAALELIWEDE